MGNSEMFGTQADGGGVELTGGDGDIVSGPFGFGNLTKFISANVNGDAGLPVVSAEDSFQDDGAVGVEFVIHAGATHGEFTIGGVDVAFEVDATDAVGVNALDLNIFGSDGVSDDDGAISLEGELSGFGCAGSTCGFGILDNEVTTEGGKSFFAVL